MGVYLATRLLVCFDPFNYRIHVRRQKLGKIVQKGVIAFAVIKGKDNSPLVTSAARGIQSAALMACLNYNCGAAQSSDQSIAPHQSIRRRRCIRVQLGEDSSVAD